ncbi:MAG: extracellular solute-binding protein [Actinobacteria bacterium]|nr:extracellular solute-binding protein [Actinomycetota bacterium]
MRVTHRASIVWLLVAAALALGGCGGRDALTLYSGRTAYLVEPMLRAFSRDTGIPIDVRYGESAELALLLAEEGERTPADVFYSQSPGATDFLQDEGLLASLRERTLRRVAPRFRDSAGRWIGVTGRQRVLVYDTERVDAADLPDSVFDLTEPAYEGKVALAPQNGSFQDFVTAMRQVYSDRRALEWLRGMSANDSPTYTDNSAIVEAASRGEVPMGLVNHYYNHQFLAEDPDLPTRNYVFPDGDIGALLIASTISVTADSDKSDEAHQLLDFLLSERAQRFFAQESFEYPLAAGVEPAGEVPPLETLEVAAYDFDDLGGGLQRTLTLIRRSGLDG